MATLRDVFWVLALGIIGCFAFFFALGGFGLGDAVGLTIVVGVLCVLWAVHVTLARRHVGTRDARLTGARERRGF